MMSKRVLLIIPELSMGGAQRSLSKLSLELSKQHKVWLLIFNRNHSINYAYGGELISLDVVPRPGFHNKVLALIQRIKKLKEIKSKLAINVSISFLEGADYINVLSRLDERVILSVRGSKEHDETIHGRYSWIRKKILIPWLYKKADTIVAVNKGIASELTHRYGLAKVRKEVIGNYYDIQEITELSKEGKCERLVRLYLDPVLVTTGRFAPEKGLKNLLAVFKKLKATNSNLRLIMIGDGPEFDNIMLTLRNLDLKVHVGRDFEEVPDVVVLNHEQNVFKYLRDAAVYLMNSSSEGFPNGLAEAMICEVPVVSSDCPYGPREILEPALSFSFDLPKPHQSENGILMPVIATDRDVDLWAETLSGLLKNKDRRLTLAKNARKRIALFDKELIISQWHQLLE